MYDVCKKMSFSQMTRLTSRGPALVVCNRNKNKVLVRLIILEFSVTDEGVLSEGFMSGKGLCLEGVIYGGGFVQGFCVREGFVQRGFCLRTGCKI